MWEAPSGGLETTVNPTSKTPPGDNNVWFSLATSLEFNVMLLAGVDVVRWISMDMIDRNSVIVSLVIDVRVFKVGFVGLELCLSVPMCTRVGTFILKHSAVLAARFPW